jgi:hypothetical protein
VTAVEMRVSRVAFYGRVADELTRQDLTPRQYQATLAAHPRQAVQKQDGWFVFADLPPDNYAIDLSGAHFQRRRLTVAAPPVGSTEIIVPGEDDVQVIANSVVAPDRVEFARLPFVPRVSDAAQVFVEGGAPTTLDELLEGVDVEGATLSSLGGIGVGTALRIVRSSRLVLRPGPYYPFPESTTVVAFRVMDSLSAGPVIAAQIQIANVNGAALSTSTVGGVTLFRAALPPVPTPFMLGTDAARTTLSNGRGDAVFYYPPNTPIAALTVDVTRTGYVPQAVTVVVQPGKRVSRVVQLVPT